MIRDVTEEKVDYSLAFDGPMFERWAKHLTAGAKKYEKRNWLKAEGQAELDRFRESAVRHFIMWYQGLTDEDHAAAVIFNLNGAEYVRARSPYEIRGTGRTDMPLLRVETPEAPEPSNVDALPPVRSSALDSCDCEDCLCSELETRWEGSTIKTRPIEDFKQLSDLPPGAVVTYTPVNDGFH